MNKKDMLNLLSRMAKGVSTMFGKNCEVVIHDLDRLDKTIICIYNGHVTGRKIGDSLSLLGKKNLKLGIINEDFINYMSKTASNHLIKSSSFFIQGEDYNFAFGINFDYTNLHMAQLSIQNLVSTESKVKDNFYNEYNIEDIFDDVVETIGIPVNLMKKKDRVRVIKLLDERGVFLLQKGITMIAKKMNISRYTIYNYLKELNPKGEC